eukprot:6466645-Amphidinium_carterae.2
MQSLREKQERALLLCHRNCDGSAVSDGSAVFDVFDGGVVGCFVQVDNRCGRNLELLTEPRHFQQQIRHIVLDTKRLDCGLVMTRLAV